MFFRQLVTPSGSFRLAGHMVAIEDDPDVEVESFEYKASTAYPPNVVVWYNNSPYISLKDVPADADTPNIAHEYWGFASINF